MSLLQARNDIAVVVQAVKTAWAAYPLRIETDNRDSIDYARQQQAFLQLDTKFLSAEQLDLGNSPKVSQYGQIILSAAAKEGSGITECLTLLDFVVPYFEHKTFGIVRTQTAQAQASKTIKGWLYQPVLINFSFTR